MAKTLVLLLCLLLSASGEGWFSKFTDGLAHGRTTRLDCGSDPSRCLKTLGRSLSLVTSKEWTPALTALSSLKGYSPNVQQFLNGLTAAIQQDLYMFNRCTNFLGTWLSLIDMIVTADFQFLTITQLLELSCNAFYEVDGEIYDACNVEDLTNALHTNTVKDYVLLGLHNSCELSKAVTYLSTCSSNYYNCGWGLGAIVRVETGWYI